MLRSVSCFIAYLLSFWSVHHFIGKVSGLFIVIKALWYMFYLFYVWGGSQKAYEVVLAFEWVAPSSSAFFSAFFGLTQRLSLLFSPFD